MPQTQENRELLICQVLILKEWSFFLAPARSMPAKLSRFLPPPTFNSAVSFSWCVHLLSHNWTASSFRTWFIFLGNTALVIPSNKKRTEQILMNYFELTPWMQNFISNRLQNKSPIWKEEAFLEMPETFQISLTSFWTMLWLWCGEELRQTRVKLRRDPH